MLIYLTRLFRNPEETIGTISARGQIFGFSLEDEKRTKKVYAETRIPAGSYPVRLRKFGAHHHRYKKRFPQFHKGMLWLMDVPGFTDILIHIGNTHKDTAGCPLIGTQAKINLDNRYSLVNSTQAYINFYKTVMLYLESGEDVYIKIRDEELSDIYDWGFN